MGDQAMSSLVRRATRSVKVAGVTIGSAAPVVVQSMTNTDTEDHISTAIQVAQLARAGSEIVRITVNTMEAAAAVPRVREQLLKMNVDVPLVGDFHFNGHKLLREHPACAEALDKLRINPGNVGKGSKRDEQYAALIDIACRYDKPVRIGVNWGSLDQALLARVMDENARRPQPGHATTSGVKLRRPIVCSNSCATITSFVRSPFGSGVSDTRMVSPMPCCSSTDIAAVEATMPLEPMPASVSPRCSG